MKNRKFLIIFVFICIIVFLILYYNFFHFGNNINRSQEQIVENLLEKFNNYEASIDVIVKSNKNENRYEIFQIVENDYSKEEIKSPENLKNMIIELEKNKLRILNSNLNMEKVYENYEYVIDNSLFLNTFANDCKNNGYSICEENGKIIIEVKLPNNSNTYIKYKDLYLNAKDKKPEKLVIKDITKKPYISIIYNDIKIK